MKIISGGQTGIDRAALDAALRARLDIGGWCPRGRRAEDGTIPDAYRLTETESAEYAQRTAWNTRDSDGTLIVTRGTPVAGTAFTIECAKKYGKPVCLVDLDTGVRPTDVLKWIRHNGIVVLNVAGPRESSSPGISGPACRFLSDIFNRLSGKQP
jgi:hypothetical protein